MRRLRDGTIEIVVATDVAARGLDIEHLSHVINFDVPTSSDAYVHRVGRTGRAGREGVALTFLEPKEQRHLRNIEQALKRRIAIENVPTGHDIRARRMERMSATLRAELERGDHAEFHIVVDTLATDYHPLDIASAALKLASAAEQDAASDDGQLDAAIAAPEPAKGSRRASKGSGKKAGKQKRGGGDIVRLFVPIGRKAGLRPADLVGAIANESNVNARSIGTIEISDNFSLVEVPDEDADAIIEALRRTTIRGTKAPKVRRERH
jgi:ATP-dependent RNA helicase DeaD